MANYEKVLPGMRTLAEAEEIARRERATREFRAAEVMHYVAIVALGNGHLNQDEVSATFDQTRFLQELSDRVGPSISPEELSRRLSNACRLLGGLSVSSPGNRKNHVSIGAALEAVAKLPQVLLVNGHVTRRGEVQGTLDERSVTADLARANNVDLLRMGQMVHTAHHFYQRLAG